MEQAQHFALRSPEIWSFCVDIFEQYAVKQPAPEERENVGGNECDDESFHEFKV